MTKVLDKLAIFECVHCGYCCKKAPCPFGEVDPTTGRCIYLVEKSGLYYCSEYESIKDKPGAELSPAFGAGCSSALNSDRWSILRHQGRLLSGYNQQRR